MTKVIDHAIAIPTRQANVWELVRDISQNPTWQLDCQRVQFLTTVKAGRGTRWRHTTTGGKEQVFEILAWYEGLGYEYRIVDGANFANSRGRIRLQEAPEGTIVQWTFSYEVTGFLGSLRNQLGTRGQIDKEIIQGLRNLYTIVKESKADESFVPEESKAYLKEAPDVEERAKYQSRHPSNIKTQEINPIVESNEDSRFKPPVSQTATNTQLIPEPPLVEDDTRPNFIIQADSPKPTTIPEPAKPLPRQPIAEPDFLRHMPEPLQGISSPKPAPIPEQKPEEETAAAPSNAALDIETEAIKAEAPKATVQPLSPERDYSKMDTAQISVFELFGLQKPSETENVRTISEAPPSLAPTPVASPFTSLPPLASPEPVAVAPVENLAKTTSEAESIFMDKTPIVPDVEPEISRRRGLRAALRQKLAPVRLPKVE